MPAAIWFRMFCLCSLTLAKAHYGSSATKSLYIVESLLTSYFFKNDCLIIIFIHMLKPILISKLLLS